MLATHAGLRKYVCSGDHTFNLAIEINHNNTTQHLSIPYPVSRHATLPQVAVEKLITEKEKENRNENKNKHKMKILQLLNVTKRFKIGSLNTRIEYLS